MNILSDVITYIRRLIKAPTNADISDALIIDYINRFWIMDVDARIQLFDLKKTYRFQTIPGIDKYNMPLYDVQIEPGNQTIQFYPVYQGFMQPAYVNGVDVTFSTERQNFYNMWPNIVQRQVQVATGDGGSFYSFQLPLSPQNFPPVNPPVNTIVRGHVDMAGIIATGINQDPPLSDSALATTLIPSIPVTSVTPGLYIKATDATGKPVVVTDSGVFLDDNFNYGLLINPGKAPNGNTVLPGGYSELSNTVNYLDGRINVTFPVPIPAGVHINVQSFYFQTGLPRSVLYYDNCITLRTVPSAAFLVEMDAYLTPAAFLNSSDSIPFAYMSEYIARGAARKIMADTGDVEQLQFYEPFFKEQENQVWVRSQRQRTATRVQTIYSQGPNMGQSNYGNFGGTA